MASARFRTFLRSATLYLGLLALFAAGVASRPEFLTLDNQRDVLWQVSSNGIIAVGMTLVILTGGIDLSVGSLLSICSVVCAMLLMERDWNEASAVAVPSFALLVAFATGVIAWRLWPKRRPGAAGALCAIAIGLIAASVAWLWARQQVPHGFGAIGALLVVPPVGLLLGAVNGTIIAKARLQPFIVTLAMMVCAIGLGRYIAGEGGQIHTIRYGQQGAPAAFKWLAANLPPLSPLPDIAASEQPWYRQSLVPVPGIFFIASAVLAWLLLMKMRAGRYIYAIGGNEDAARYSGINTDRFKTLVYAISGLLCGVAGVLYCAQFQQGKADAGSGRELDAIAAVAIGGTSLMGGRGSIGGTIVGVFIFGYLNNILNLRGVSTEFQAILKGVIIIVAVLLQEGIFTRWIAGSFGKLKTQLLRG